ncbi:hypothetical protein JQX13_46035 [Archangium violaceum]|uniref:hypothetical protein n=1 Tax=Archangium violaceum TaxID=83451 RepID=UPI00193C5B70|nr:hypothetical protein [Archangium violaceum]QRK07324.1 hypothetical protein JQX13_46035 [Archangium violaceum]
MRALVGTGQFGVLVWRSNGGTAPTELHLPASFAPGATTVVSSIGSVRGVPAYTGAESVAAAAEPGVAGVNRLLLSTRDSNLHFALVTNGAGGASLEAAGAELAAWVSATFGG